MYELLPAKTEDGSS